MSSQRFNLCGTLQARTADEARAGEGCSAPTPSPAARPPLREGDPHSLVPPRQEYGCILDQRPQLGLHGDAVSVTPRCCSSMKLRMETPHAHRRGPREKAISQLLFHSLNQIY